MFAQSRYTFVLLEKILDSSLILSGKSFDNFSMRSVLGLNISPLYIVKKKEDKLIILRRTTSVLRRYFEATLPYNCFYLPDSNFS